MRIVNFSKNGTPTLAVRRRRKLVDLSVAAPELARDLKGLVAGGARALSYAEAAAAKAGADAQVEEKGLIYLPPVHNPAKIICMGLNYRDHAIETGNEIPKYPVVFSRAATTLSGHGPADGGPESIKAVGLRVRAGGGYRPGRPAHQEGPRARPCCGLFLLQRRLDPRLSVQVEPVHHGQELRRPRAASARNW